MKLPKWQERSGTSMQGAYSTPAQRGQQRQLIPETRSLIPLNSIAGEMALGRAKANKYAAIAGGVGDIASTYMKIKIADDSMAQKAAASEYNNRMAIYATDLKTTGNELDEDGNPNWESYAKRMDDESTRLKEELRGTHKFSMKDSETNWAINTNGVDRQFKVNTIEYVNGKTIERAGAKYAIAMAGASIESAAQGINEEAVSSGLISPEDGIENMQKWRTKTTYENAITTMQTQGLGSLEAIQKKAQTGAGNFSNLTIPQRNQIESAALDQVKSIQITELDRVYRKEGYAGAAKYIESVSNDGSGAVSALDHKSVVSSMTQRYNQLEAIEKANYVEQAVKVDLGVFYGAEPDIDGLEAFQMDKGSDQYKLSLKTLDSQLMQIIDEPDFYQKVTPIAARLAYIGESSKVIRNSVEQDIRSGDPARLVAASEFISTVRADRPTAFNDIDSALVKKADTVSYQIRELNIDPQDQKEVSKLLTQYNTVQSMSDAEKNDSNAQASAHLAQAEKGGFNQFMTDLAVKKGDVPEGEELVQTAQSQVAFKGWYKEAFLHTKNPAFAAEQAYARYRETYGVVDVDGELTTERNPPELLTPPGTLTQAENRTYVTEQKQKSLTEYNLSRKDTDGYAPVSLEDVEFVNNGKNAAGDDIWIVTDKGQVALPMGDGSLAITIAPYANKKAPKAIENTNNNNSKQMTDRQQRIVSSNSIRLIDNGIKFFDPGGAGGFTKETQEQYNFAWRGMSDADKETANLAWRAMYNTIREANTGMQINDDAMIEWYLFSSGYMKTGEDGNWVRPPGMKYAD